MDIQKLEVLHGHYIDTFSQIRAHRKERDRLFSFLLVIVALMLFDLAAPAEFGRALSALIVTKLELKEPLDISFVSALIWFALLAFLVRYFQAVVHIERQYQYLHNLEGELSQVYEGKAFTREGTSYLADYPAFSMWAHILYQTVFPILLIATISVKVANELFSEGADAGWVRVFAALAYAAALVSTVLYLLVVNRPPKKRQRESDTGAADR